ncbi:MAG: class I SAM-dependent methyltransferase [Clostridiaceae bacterium]|jgi:SAM-dependent methyltransferase|nr:class I SAM-dependent methyltransferase [Clostridiaceae bacterium]
MNEKKFNDKAEAYVAARPSYPAEFINMLFDVSGGIGMSQSSTVVDVGSGTGKFAELLLDRGAKVFAVEPNDDMRAAAEKRLSAHRLFVSVRGSAENTTLADKSADFVTAAQAFHWFDAAAFRNECLRILKPGDKALLVWNAFDDTDKNCCAYGEILRAHCPLFRGFGGGYADNPGAIQLFFDGAYQTATYTSVQSYDRQGLINRALSASYTPRPSDDGYAAFIDTLSAFFDARRHEGKINFSNRTNAYYGALYEKAA